MLFCGIEKVSMNDYPEKISCVLFTSGCNFFCPYCHNPTSVARNQSVVDEDYIFHLINKRKFLYDGIVISGGEPTLWDDLSDVCRRIKKIGFSIKLDTNGSRPNVLRSLLSDKLVDYVAMDIKTVVDNHSYRKFTAEPDIVDSIKASISIIMDKAKDYEFRTTCVGPFVDRTAMNSMSLSIKDAKRYTLQKFNSYALDVLDKDFKKEGKHILEKEEIGELVKVACNNVESCSMSVSM